MGMDVDVADNKPNAIPLTTASGCRAGLMNMEMIPIYCIYRQTIWITSNVVLINILQSQVTMY